MDERSDDRLRGEQLEEALAALLYDEGARTRLRAGQADDPRLVALDVDELDEAARGVRRMVRERVHRGTGGVETWFPATLAAWRAAHPGDSELDDLLTRFCASRSCRGWREIGIGISLEEAFFRFFLDAGIGNPEIVEDEFLAAVVRALAITPRARFEWPAGVRPAPGGCYALTRQRVLHAALDATYVHGPVTTLVAALLEGETPDNITRRYGLGRVEIDSLTSALRTRRLVP